MSNLSLNTAFQRNAFQFSAFQIAPEGAAPVVVKRGGAFYPTPAELRALRDARRKEINARKRKEAELQEIIEESYLRATGQPIKPKFVRPAIRPKKPKPAVAEAVEPAIVEPPKPTAEALVFAKSLFRTEAVEPPWHADYVKVLIEEAKLRAELELAERSEAIRAALAEPEQLEPLVAAFAKFLSAKPPKSEPTQLELWQADFDRIMNAYEGFGADFDRIMESYEDYFDDDELRRMMAFLN